MNHFQIYIFTEIELPIIRHEINKRYPFVPDPSVTSGVDIVFWMAQQKERVRSEVDRRLRSLPLNQYLKEKKRLEPFLK